MLKKEELNKKIKDWLDTEPSKRDVLKGLDLIMLFKPNRILFRKVSLAPKAYAKYIEDELKKYYNIRLEQGTHEEVVKMAEVVEGIAKARNLDNNRSEFRQGKRIDHDDLPNEIRQLYIDNADIMKRMREVHLKLRSISASPGFCPDSDRWPFLKELIALDKKYRSNWHAYDTYDLKLKKSTFDLDENERAKKALRLVNLNAGRYRNNRSEVLKAQILDWLKEVPAPPQKTIDNLKELGIL